MSSFEAAFTVWLRKMRPALDLACGEAMREGLHGLSGADLQAANASLNLLYASETAGGCFGESRDCDYALPGTGALYTGHWHGKRVHNCLSMLVPLRSGLMRRALHVIDTGAGTGAAIWAWSLIAWFRHLHRETVPIHTWTSIDCSLEMLAQNDRLWTQLCKVLPKARDIIRRRPPVAGDWRKPPPLPTRGLILGSYLFSREDANQPQRTGRQFATFVKRASASKVALWTIRNKSSILDSIRANLGGWQDHSSQKLFTSPLRGRMSTCIKVAAEAFRRRGLPADEDWLRRFNWGGGPTNASLLAMARPA